MCVSHANNLQAVLVQRLTSATVTYLWLKGSIVGPSWKTPFIGPFLESVYPDFNKYKAKWASGELSCVSVFHKYQLYVPRPIECALTIYKQIRCHCLHPRHGSQSLQLTHVRQALRRGRGAQAAPPHQLGLPGRQGPC